VVKVDDQAGESVPAQVFDRVADQRTIQKGQGRFGSTDRQRPEPRSKTGGEYHCCSGMRLQNARWPEGVEDGRDQEPLGCHGLESSLGSIMAQARTFDCGRSGDLAGLVIRIEFKCSWSDLAKPLAAAQ
jgi:hypothetical protein